MQTSSTKLSETGANQAPKGRNRRRCVRQRVHSPAYVVLKKSGSEVPIVHEILNIGESGISFQSSSRLPVGHRLHLSLDLPETGDTIFSQGRVMWSQSSGEAGIRFRKMSRAAHLRLREWLFVNALAAAARHAARQQPAPENRSAGEPASAGALRRELEVVSPRDYGAILIELASIQKQLKAAGPQLETCLQILNERCRRLTGSHGSAIALWDGREMICRASSGTAPAVGARFYLGTGFSGQCVRAAELLRCDDSETDMRVDRESCRALGVRSIMAAPAVSREGVVGLLEVFSSEPFAFNARSKIFLQRLAQMTTTAVQDAANALDKKRQADSILSGEYAFAGSGSGEAPPAFSNVPPPSAQDDDMAPPFPWRRWLPVLAPVAVLIVLAALLIPAVRSHLRGPAISASGSPSTSQEAALTASPAPAGESDFDHLQRLAAQGDAAAQFAVGAHYALGEDVTQDYSRACHWFALAAEQGHVIAQATLGAYYWSGRGVPKDLDKAYFWSILAQAGGDEASKYRVAALASTMSHSQVVAAQEQANDWLRQHQLASKRPSESRRKDSFSSP